MFRFPSAISDIQLRVQNATYTFLRQAEGFGKPKRVKNHLSTLHFFALDVDRISCELSCYLCIAMAERTSNKHMEIGLLVPALRCSKNELLENSGRPYSSVTMGVGVNVANLVKFLPMLDFLVELDQRGGFFFHDELVDALAQLSREDAEWFGRVKQIGVEMQTSVNAVFQRLAMYIRVMLNHLRVKKRYVLKGGHTAPTPELVALKPILDKIVFVSSAPPTRAYKDFEMCPLPFFRPGSSADAISDDSDCEPKVELVTTYWDGELMQAVQLYQDSSLVPATWYEPTAAGLVLACFENGATLQLEIPNVCLVDGKLDVGALVPPPMPKAKA